MGSSQQDFTKIGFQRTFIVPALLVFLVPVVGLVFFLFAQAHYDDQAREGIIKQISQDPRMTAEERAEATAFFNEHPFSQLIMDPRVAADVDAGNAFDYATFRWMIRISAASIVAGVTVFVLAGICVLWSLRSQQAQYLSMLCGWHVLRIYGALQTIAVGILLVALSYWVTALLFHAYYVKLIFLAGALSAVAVYKVCTAIFKTPSEDFVVEGHLVDKEAAAPLWQAVNAICAKVGATPPDQVIAGIDDNFFVTELPVIVTSPPNIPDHSQDSPEYAHVLPEHGSSPTLTQPQSSPSQPQPPLVQQCQGKTLFVSLPLLKQLRAEEADAVVAHEMAHFSGQDTLYSKKIAPLRMRYAAYLQSLQEGAVTLPVFYFMLCFRALFEFSLARLSRQREFRADAIAASATSPRDFSSALLRIVAYSKFRQSVENDLFIQEQELANVEVSHQIERGFPDYAVSFAADPEFGSLESVHPFDTHPPTAQRFSALGVCFDATETQRLLSAPGDGRWHRYIASAEEMERRQWQAYNERFRTRHKESLPFRFLPETAEEQAVVEEVFPAVHFDGSEGILLLDFEKVQHAPWPEALYYSQIKTCTLNDGKVLKIDLNSGKQRSLSIKITKFPKEQRDQVLHTFQHYYGRYLAAIDYQTRIKASMTNADPAASDDDAPT